MTTLEKIRAEIAELEERIADLPNMADAYAAVWHCLDIIDKYAEQEPCDDNRLYIKVYADLEPQEKAEKLYQICGKEELLEVYKELGEYCEIEPCDDAISRQAVLDELNKWEWQELYLPIHFKENIIDVVPSVRPQEHTGKCRTCKYGEIYNDLWCKCHDPLLDGVMVKMTDQCRAEEIIDLNCKYKAERSGEE